MSKPEVYTQHDAAFANVAAYVILHNGERVASIAFKFPRDGAGRLYVYVHWFGTEMVRGFAGGYGYDKQSAACVNAAKKLSHTGNGDADALCDFSVALQKDDGSRWYDQLRKAGFDVLQAV